MSARPARLIRPFIPSRLQAFITARLVDRFSPSALRRFQRTHRLPGSVQRGELNSVAVIVPCYNHASYLEATVNGLARQTYRPFEVVFVDDRSTDDTWPRLQRLAPQLPAGILPRLIQTLSNSGQAFAINLGVIGTRAAALMILNDDDYLVHDALEATLEIMRQNSDVFLFGANSVPFSGSDEPAADDPRLTLRHHFHDYTAIPLTRYTPEATVRFTEPRALNMTHSSSCFCRSAWQAVGGYYPDKARRVVAYSDRDFQLRVASLFPVVVAQTVPFVFWRAGSSVDHARNS